MTPKQELQIAITDPALKDLLSADMARAGFSVDAKPETPRLVISTAAREKEGKTHFALTMPDHMAVIATDTGTVEQVNRARARGKHIALCELVADGIKSKTDAETEWNKVVAALDAVLANRSIRSLVIDTATELWEILRLARFGKLTQVMPHHYGPVNDEFRKLVKKCMARPWLNQNWIHKVKKEYKGASAGSEKEVWTGKYERAGFGDMGYLVDLELVNYFDIRKVDDEGIADKRGEKIQRVFGVRVAAVGATRHNPELAGESFETILGHNPMQLPDMCDFTTLARMCWPQTKDAYWQ